MDSPQTEPVMQQVCPSHDIIMLMGKTVMLHACVACIDKDTSLYVTLSCTMHGLVTKDMSQVYRVYVPLQ